MDSLPPTDDSRAPPPRKPYSPFGASQLLGWAFTALFGVSFLRVVLAMGTPVPATPIEGMLGPRPDELVLRAPAPDADPRDQPSGVAELLHDR